MYGHVRVLAEPMIRRLAVLPLATEVDSGKGPTEKWRVRQRSVSRGEIAGQLGGERALSAGTNVKKRRSRTC